MIIEKNETDLNLEILIENEFEKYENQNKISYNYVPFHFVAKENDEILGIVAGHTCFSEVHISDLVVMESHRDKSVGTQLVKAVEEYYKGCGFDNINLCTYEFQAPKFYEKLGYQLEFIRKNINNPKINKYYFVKYFNDVK